MQRRSLLWTFFPPVLAVLVLSLVLVTGFAGQAVRAFLVRDTGANLEHAARLTVSTFAVALAAGDEAQVQETCRRYHAMTGMRFTVILADGRVAGDSLEDPGRMDNHADRPEFAAALAGQAGHGRRYSTTLDHQRLYCAVAAAGGDGTPFVVRTSVSESSLAEVMRGALGRIALAGLVLALLAGVTAYLLSRRLRNALARLQAGAEAFARGDLGQRTREADSAEIAALADAMNRMADQLGRRIETIDAQRRELEAVMSSMIEGVIAVDLDETVISMNEVAARLLGQMPPRAVGRSIQEAARDPDLTAMVQQALSSGATVERDVRLGDRAEICVQATATDLRDGEGALIGALLVLNDVTRLRRLEIMRRDFVANVSHELRTPITSIKGFVETLLDHPPADPAETRRFMGIISRQADRLDAIISDLLALSRLEKDTESGGIERVELPVRPLLERLLRDLAARDADGAARLSLDCGGEVRAACNAALLEQAVGNLVDNALKYSQPGSPVVITCTTGPETVSIAVNDRGPGIAAEHLPRVFERFYRVDKARSRTMGGTGLGLAIVKHIAQAHRGHVTAASEVGKGSTFTINLPREVSA
ncbi:MAG: PAS domain-containing protein [Krumholzibacteria bacterium]|nr:PAS domain-containing protein [Candidatus Krumholzibacteria bacterium]